MQYLNVVILHITNWQGVDPPAISVKRRLWNVKQATVSAFV
ncbi:hypothetical protein [Bifidobacterium aquikefiri]|nr:hypothetical protein [Bifidobacterium aquikefiri]